MRFCGKRRTENSRKTAKKIFAKTRKPKRPFTNNGKTKILFKKLSKRKKQCFAQLQRVLFVVVQRVNLP